MIIELRNLHARWKLLLENGCMLLVNENETVWDLTGFGMCGCVTNKGKTNSMEGRDVAKLIGQATETANPTLAQNRPCTLYRPYPAYGPLLPAGSCCVVRPRAVRRCFTHSNP
jgi:hypothetical protein